MLCGWLGVCLVVLVLLLSLFWVNGRARRVVWRDAGQVRCVAFGAWLRDLWSMVRPRLVRCLGRAMRGNVRILGNLPLRGIRQIRRFGICLMPVLRHLCLWVLFLQRLFRSTITNVLQLLAGLGVSEVLLQQIKSSIPPPATGKQKNAGPEKQLQIITGKITVLEQQVVKLEKQKDRLVRELDECHASRADKESQLELLRAQYREVRDTGKFTPTRVSPAPSVRAASVAGDEVPSRDVNMEDVGAAVGSSAGAGGEQASGSSELRESRGTGQADAHEVLLLRLGRSRLILAREGVWKLLGLLRLKRSLLGGGITF